MSNANPNAGHNNIFSNFIHSMNHTSSNMMSSSNDSSSNAGPVYSANRQQPLLQGTAYKLHKKSGKKQKYFVIFDDAPDKPGTARLEYFDNEKKFRSAMAKSPDNGITNQKRSIILCSCFNINRRVDTPKYKNVIGLYRKDDTFSIIMKDEKEMNDWLKQLLVLQRGKELLDGDQPRPIFEHVWEVNVIRRGLGESFGIIGSYRLCISDTTLSLIRVGPDKTTTGDRRVDHVEFALANMRRCGSTLSVFFMEVGRYTLTGAGEIWMETWDPMVAHSMSETILRTAGNKKTNKTEDLGPIMRNRSQSANEASKPINHRRLTQIGPATVRLNVSGSSTRERCDSLTLTRTRTNSDSSSNATIQPQLHSLPHQNGISNYNNNNNSMPPPKKIPSRPLSNVFTQRNSPPNNSSPLSPPSATYSTESDGSSISIDEPDFSHHPTEDHFYPKEYQSSITSKTTIPEENENYHQRWTNNNLSLPLNQNNRKGSPNAAPNALPDYMDMGPYSPYSSSPLEGGANNANVYMPMSPGVDYRNDRMYNSSGAHSRASSLAEDNESYVAMHPSSNNADVILQPTGTDDYMNMRPSISSSRNSTRGGDISSATSSCSITSGTPSTDIRFSEYHLDKVQARFTPCEDDDLDRPPRTYSVGSKLEHKRKIAVDRFLAEHISSRHRAYSVGSKNIKVTRAELTSHSGSHTPSHNSPTAINHHQEINNNNNTKNKKSSSAPLLVNHSGRNAHGSGDHMDDLMEIDYSNRSTESINVRHNNVGSPFKSSPVNIPTKTGEDYMNMSGRNSKPHTPSGSNPSPYVDMRPASVRKISENADNEYMDMNAPPRRTNSLSSSPMKNMSAPRTVPLPPSSSNNSYMEMSPRSYDSRKNRMISSATSLSSAKAPSDDYLNMSPVNKSLLEVGLPSQSSAPDGYMEMSWNTKNKKSTVIVDKSNENPSSSSDEYINMDFSNNNDGAGTSDSSSSAKDRSISLPITIQKRHSSSSRSKKSTSGSIEEAPPVYLPLANPMTASISPTQSTNRIRCDSRDSGIVTPSSGSQATIFPFSPGSPKKFEAMEDLSRKILMDGTSGTIKLSEDDIIEEEPRTPVPMGMNSEKHVETLSSDYAVMNLGEPVSKKPNLAATPVQIKPSPPSANTSHFLLNPDSGNNDYINCTPNAPSSSSRIVTPKPISPAAHNSKQEVGDYALMNPLKTSMSPVQTPQSSSETPPQTAAKKSLYLQLSSHEKLNSNSCFKPIVEDDQSNRGSHPPLHRQVSERGLQHINDSGYEMLSRPSLSRPNSVNNERIKCTPSFLSNRPSSALSSTSLSSNSTLCEIRSQNSSSQTLRNMMDTSAVPSPMSGTSRPESVSSDIHMASRPPSVTSERELHYASLELPPCSSTNLYSLSSSHQKMDVDQKMDFSTSPSPQQTSSSSSSASSQQSQPAFTYAQIDFAKSESLKAQQQQNQSGSKK